MYHLKLPMLLKTEYLIVKVYLILLLGILLIQNGAHGNCVIYKDDSSQYTSLRKCLYGAALRRN